MKAKIGDVRCLKTFGVMITYENMAVCGCKYCDCSNFVEGEQPNDQAEPRRERD